MSTSAQQSHQGQMNTAPVKAPDKRLYIDLDICSTSCEKCTVECSYYYHQQKPTNNGIVSVKELATYAVVCRRCEEPHCVNACPKEALSQQKEKNKLLVRHYMRCVSCKTCSHACPYGTIYPEHVPYLIHNCDFCLDRRDKPDEPLCIKTCPYGALSLKPADEELGPDTFLVGDNIIVHCKHWEWEKA